MNAANIIDETYGWSIAVIVATLGLYAVLVATF
jgi:hypothetical protein